jgi:signal peptidase II
MKKKFFIITIILIILDRAIKMLIAHLIPWGKSIAIIKDFFYITAAKNYGAAWSILEGSRNFLIAVGLVSLLAIYWLFIKNKKLNNIEIITYSFLIAGILGNLIDRIFLGYVVDYLEFIIRDYYFPIFNLADSLIVISVVLISVSLLKEGD